VIFTIPNLISALRIAAVPLFLWLLLGPDRPAAAGWMLVAIGSTDWIDGYLARKLDQVSELGKMLDPVADRFAIVAAVVGGWIAGVLPWWVALLLLVRETGVGLMALYLAWRSRARIDVRYLGKMATWAVYGGVASFYIYAGSGWQFFRWWAWIYILPGLVLYYAVAGQYLGDVREALAEPPPSVSSG
jgi:cardiolipin synthase